MKKVLVCASLADGRSTLAQMGEREADWKLCSLRSLSIRGLTLSMVSFTARAMVRMTPQQREQIVPAMSACAVAMKVRSF